MVKCSAPRRSALGLVLSATLGLVACSDAGNAPSGSPPTPGNIGGTTPSATAAPNAPSSEAQASDAQPGPRADAPAAPGPVLAKGDASGAATLPADFSPKTFCLMPKLSHCSAYGTKYNKLDSVSKFCGALGGEETTYCPSNGMVAKCRTPADVVTFYYAAGEKPYTKDAAEAKCGELGWEVLP